MDKMVRLTQTVKDFLITSGAVAVGIATPETLAGGPPSADLTYVLPSAKSAVCFALPLDQDLIERFLKKEEYRGANIDNRRTNTLASGLATELAVFLDMMVFKSFAVASNLRYRKDIPGGVLEEKPDIAHRYLAVRSGIGHFGLSGNVIRKEEGAAIILGSVVTEAELIPTDPLPPEENYCDRCGLCQAACASGLMSEDEEATITLGGVEFTYSKRRSHHRCDYVCGGFAGLAPSGKWSTWSPARFPIPEKDEEFMPAILNAAQAYKKRQKGVRGFFHAVMPGKEFEITCSHCQLICHPDKEVRKRRYKMLMEGGVVVQNPDGTLKSISPEAAEAYVASLSPGKRALYEDVGGS